MSLITTENFSVNSTENFNFFCKGMFIACSENISTYIIHEQKASILLFKKLHRRKLKNIQSILKEEKHSSQKGIKSMESYLYLISYLYPRRVTIDTKFYIFQYELLHDILYLN